MLLDMTLTVSGPKDTVRHSTKKYGGWGWVVPGSTCRINAMSAIYLRAVNHLLESAIQILFSLVLIETMITFRRYAMEIQDKLLWI